MGVEYVIVDLETTGLSPREHSITEIAAVRVKNNYIVDKFQTLVNPGTTIPPFITGLTGITDEMVKDAPPLQEALKNFLQFLGNDVLVAHNAQFDVGFLQHHARQNLGVEISNQSICTKKLASTLIPELRSRKLSSLCKHFEIVNEQAHRAMSDVKATFNVMQNFLDIMKEKEMKFDHVLKQQNSLLVNNRSNKH
jgi:DNA polymerase-3 subunit alpha (Gram-positive type)